MRFSLGRKIILSTTLTIILFGFLATATVFFYVKKTVLEIKKSQLVLLSKNTAREIYREFSDTQRTVNLIATQPEIAYFLLNNDESINVNELLNNYNIKEKYSAIYVISGDGKIKASTDPSLINQDHGIKKYFSKSIVGQDSVEAAIDLTSYKTGYYVSTPVRGIDGTIVGVVVIKTLPDVINQLVLPSGLTIEGHVMMVDNHGVIIYSDKADRIYKSLGGLSDIERAEISKMPQFFGLKIQGLDYEPVYNLIKDNKKRGNLEFYDAADNSDEILVMDRIGDLSFYVVFEEETDTFSGSAVNVGILISLFVALAALIAAFIIAILTRNFLKPLNIIIQSLKAIGMGKYEDRIMINSNDELSEVANIVNEMLSKIKKHEEEIDEKIKKRTRDLEKFNHLMVGREIKMIELKRKIDDLHNKNLKQKPLTMLERLESGISVEEKVIRELDSFYIYKVKSSDLSKEKKQKILKLLKTLISDSKNHYQIINSIILEYEGKYRNSN